jgi:hypothetical protein
MIKNYNQIMPNLEQDIISTIRRKQKQNIILKQSYFLITSILSFVGIIYSGFYIADAIAVSGSFQFASLVFYDISMLSYWKEISLSIAESFPFFGFAWHECFNDFLLVIIKEFKSYRL